jgi:hypothetical protein
MFIATFVTPPVTLADAARREAFRRRMSPPAVRTLTDSDVPRALPEPVVVSPDAVSSPVAPPTPGQPNAASGVPALPGAPGKTDEKAWREWMTNARAMLDRDQLLADALQSRINALTNDVAARDDPYQRAALAVQRQQTVDELTRMQIEIEADRKTIADIEEQARVDGIPPGWIRLEPAASSPSHPD